MQIPIPDAFAATVSSAFGQPGVDWLAALPATLAECAARWSLTIQPPFPQLSYNFAAPAALADGTTAVLKLGVPRPELTREITALNLYNGDGICRLLASDAALGALLLERLEPGDMLARLCDTDDDAATRILAEVMQRLWRLVPDGHPFRPLHEWADGLARLRPAFGGTAGPFPPELVTTAESLFTDLLTDAAPTAVLLHGDLHHYNVLRAARRPWLAIDPKGIVGPPAYDVSNLLRNPFDLHTRPDLASLLARRVAILAEMLPFSRAEICGWGVAQSVLSAWWDFEDFGRVDQHVLHIAHLLNTLRAPPHASVGPQR